MITLYAFGPAAGLPDFSPFVTKAEVLLKMSGLPYGTDTTGFRKAPKGKLPYIVDDGEIVADSTFRWHLEHKYRVDFDIGLTPEQRAIAWAFEKTAEDNLYWVMVDLRWTDDENFAHGAGHFFKAVPALVRPLVAERCAAACGRKAWAGTPRTRSPRSGAARSTRSPISSATNHS
jgi:Glutathione S-transferase N-terminal domain